MLTGKANTFAKGLRFVSQAFCSVQFTIGAFIIYFEVLKIEEI